MTEILELPIYVCHKRVKGLEIDQVTIKQGYAVLTFTDKRYPPIKVSPVYMSKHKPVRGGYYVVYEDGYVSFSSKKAFENGYTKEEEIHDSKSVLKIETDQLFIKERYLPSETIGLCNLIDQSMNDHFSCEGHIEQIESDLHKTQDMISRMIQRLYKTNKLSIEDLKIITDFNISDKNDLVDDVDKRGDQ